MEQALEFAHNEAQKGYIDSMRSFLDEAVEKAERLRLDINTRIKIIEQVGYENALQIAVEQATDFAQQGNMRIAGLYLELADHHAIHLGDNARARVRKARSSLGIATSE
jgi:phosphatidylserine decarboxylase